MALGRRQPFFWTQVASAIASLTLSGMVWAQQPAAPVPPPQSSPASDSPEYVPPTVSDPMLQPVATASRQLASWQEAISQVRSRSADLQVALLDVTRAEAQSRVALAGLLPTITGTANVTRNLLRSDVQVTDYSPLFQNPPGQPIPHTQTIPTATTYGGTLTITQPVIAPRAWHAQGTAELQEQLARMSVQDRKRNLAFGLAQSIMAVVTAERVAELNRVGLRGALEREELTRRRAALGAGTALDVLRSQQDTTVARNAVVSGDEALRKAREALGLALGVGAGIGVAPNISLDGLHDEAKLSCPALQRIEDRPDLRAAGQQVALGQRNTRDVWLQFAPTVNLLSRTDFSSEQLVNTKHVAWSIAGVLTIPLWEGGARYGLLRDARAQTDQARQRRDAALRGARIEVEQARRAVTVSEQALVISQQERDLAKESERMSRVMFAAGKATSFELVDAGRRLREAEINLAVREFELVQARLASLLTLARCDW